MSMLTSTKLVFFRKPSSSEGKIVSTLFLMRLICCNPFIFGRLSANARKPRSLKRLYFVKILQSGVVLQRRPEPQGRRLLYRNPRWSRLSDGKALRLKASANCRPSFDGANERRRFVRVFIASTLSSTSARTPTEVIALWEIDFQYAGIPRKKSVS
jgi:hypothetical protein